MSWISPIIHKGQVKHHSGETTPFVFNDSLYRLDNVPASFPAYPNTDPEYHKGGYHEDVCEIWDVEANTQISIPLQGHYFAMAYVWQNRVYIFAADHRSSTSFWKMKKLNMIWSDDLTTWSAPVTVFQAEENEHMFNFGVCHDGNRFVLLYETDDPQWNIFTFKYLESDDLIHWAPIPGAVYGTDKYVGGPALYYEGGTFYTLYLHALGNSHYETRITRSKDLIDWEDAPEDRPFATFNSDHITDPVHFPGVAETNASDVELCYWQGKTFIYFNGGNQGEINISGDLQLSEFEGTPCELFTSFFEDTVQYENRAYNQRLENHRRRPFSHWN